MAGAAAVALDHGLQQRAESGAVALDFLQCPGAEVVAGDVSALKRGNRIADRPRVRFRGDGRPEKRSSMLA
jgi:hypothetical protein